MMRSHRALQSQEKHTNTEPSIAERMLALIPDVPDDTLIFVQNEENDPWEECYSAHTSWGELSDPITAIPDDHVGIDNLRKIAADGYATVIPYNQPVHSAHLLKSVHQLLAAGPVVYTRPGARRRHLPGLVFHPGNSTLTAHVRGEANPHLGYGRQHGHNKWWEWQFVSRIDPTVMPETVLINQLPIWHHPILEEMRTLIRCELEDIIHGKTNKFTDNAILSLMRYVNHVFFALRLKFPAGAFIKPVESSCSGDFHHLITTDSNVSMLVDYFLEIIYWILEQVPHSEQINSSQMRLLLLAESNPACLVVHDLLFNSEEVIGQETLPIAKTALGTNFEVRVDFLQGKSVASMMRYYLADYYPREEKAAANFLDAFFKKADFPEQLLCGGADLALGQDGKWYIIEFNLGAESFGLKLGTHWNSYVSTILGRNTTLITIFETIFSAPLNEQQKFIAGLVNTILNHPDVDDLGFVYLWFRDRYCRLFDENPTPETREKVVDSLTKLFDNDTIHYNSMIESANAYMKRELLHISMSEYKAPKQTAISVKSKATLFTQTQASGPVKSGTKRHYEEDNYTKKRLI